MLVPTIKVSAQSYISKDDTIIGSNYYDFYKAQFGEDKYYKFFAYNCNGSSTYNRTCYYGIDRDFNYIQIKYNSSNEMEIVKGIDKDFSVTGTNIIDVKPSPESQIAYGLNFILVFFIIYTMLGVVFL